MLNAIQTPVRFHLHTPVPHSRALVYIRYRTYIVLISSKPMIYPRGQNNQIALLKPDPHPLIPLTPNVKVPRSVANVSYLLVLVKMLVEEHFHLGFVDIAHGGGGDGDFIAVLVVAVAGEGVDGGEIGVVGVEDAEGGELGWRDGAG
jgi:hypothetical protein